MRKKIAIVQARLSSTRLPNKVLKNILTKPLIQHVIDRLNESQLIDQVVIATTTEDEDNLIVKWCQKNKVPFFRGDRDDVLSRFYFCAKENQASDIIRVTSDNPLTDPKIIDKTIEYYLEGDLDYCSNNLEKSYPHGLDVEVFNFGSLEKSHNESSDPVHREHVTQYIRQNKDLFNISAIKHSKDLSHIRVTMDENEDFQLIEIVMSLLSEKANLEELDALFEKYPALLNVNNGSKERHKTYNEGQGIN